MAPKKEKSLSELIEDAEDKLAEASDSLQKVLVAADSVEETVMTSINSKLKNLEALYE